MPTTDVRPMFGPSLWILWYTKNGTDTSFRLVTDVWSRLWSVHLLSNNMLYSMPKRITSTIWMIELINSLIGVLRLYWCTWFNHPHSTHSSLIRSPYARIVIIGQSGLSSMTSLCTWHLTKRLPCMVHPYMVGQGKYAFMMMYSIEWYNHAQDALIALSAQNVLYSRILTVAPHWPDLFLFSMYIVRRDRFTSDICY